MRRCACDLAAHAYPLSRNLAAWGAQPRQSPLRRRFVCPWAVGFHRIPGIVRRFHSGRRPRHVRPWPRHHESLRSDRRSPRRCRLHDWPRAHRYDHTTMKTIGTKHAPTAVKCRNRALGFGNLASRRPFSRPRRVTSVPSPLAPQQPAPARAKRVIFLFMHGGPSQVDATFDYKPLLARRRRPAAAIRQATRRLQPKTGNLLQVAFRVRPAWSKRAVGGEGVPRTLPAVWTTCASFVPCMAPTPGTAVPSARTAYPAATPSFVPAMGLVDHLWTRHRKSEPAAASSPSAPP